MTTRSVFSRVASDGDLGFVEDHLGLDHDGVGAALFEGDDLLGEGVVHLGFRDHAKRFDELAGWTDGPSDVLARPGLGFGVFGGEGVQFGDAILSVVVPKSKLGTAKGVREDEIGSGIEVGARHAANGFGGVGVHQLWASARFEAVLL